MEIKSIFRNPVKRHHPHFDGNFDLIYASGCDNLDYAYEILRDISIISAINVNTMLDILAIF